MENVEQIVSNQQKRKRRQNRRKALLQLIDSVLSGKFDSGEEPINNLFEKDTPAREMSPQAAPRPHYVSPRDRSTYNSGYMQVDEMTAGTPNIWF